MPKPTGFFIKKLSVGGSAADEIAQHHLDFRIGGFPVPESPQFGVEPFNVFGKNQQNLGIIGVLGRVCLVENGQLSDISAIVKYIFMDLFITHTKKNSRHS